MPLRRTSPKLAAAVIALLLSPLSHAASATPVGTWKTIDDATGEPKAIIRIVEEQGELKGKLTRYFKPEREVTICRKCDGALKDKSVVGMQILSGLRRDGVRWKDGKILNPEDGRFYSVEMSMTDEGSTLKVRGYFGVSLLGRTQLWQRVPDNQ